jgi:hypothetical protein
MKNLQTTRMTGLLQAAVYEEVFDDTVSETTTTTRDDNSN